MNSPSDAFLGEDFIELSSHHPRVGSPVICDAASAKKPDQFPSWSVVTNCLKVAFQTTMRDHLLLRLYSNRTRAVQSAFE